MEYLLTNLRTQESLGKTEWNPSDSKPTLVKHLEGKTHPRTKGGLDYPRADLAMARSDNDPIGWFCVQTNIHGTLVMEPYR